LIGEEKTERKAGKKL